MSDCNAPQTAGISPISIILSTHRSTQRIPVAVSRRINTSILSILIILDTNELMVVDEQLRRTQSHSSYKIAENELNSCLVFE